MVDIRDRESLQDLLDGRLSPFEEERLRRRLGREPELLGEYRRLRDLGGLIRAAHPASSYSHLVPVGFASRVVGNLDQAGASHPGLAKVRVHPASYVAMVAALAATILFTVLLFRTRGAGEEAGSAELMSPELSRLDDRAIPERSEFAKWRDSEVREAQPSARAPQEGPAPARRRGKGGWKRPAGKRGDRPGVAQVLEDDAIAQSDEPSQEERLGRAEALRGGERPHQSGVLSSRVEKKARTLREQDRKDAKALVEDRDRQSQEGSWGFDPATFLALNADAGLLRKALGSASPIRLHRVSPPSGARGGGAAAGGGVRRLFTGAGWKPQPPSGEARRERRIEGKSGVEARAKVAARKAAGAQERSAPADLDAGEILLIEARVPRAQLETFLAATQALGLVSVTRSAPAGARSGSPSPAGVLAGVIPASSQVFAGGGLEVARLFAKAPLPLDARLRLVPEDLLWDHRVRNAARAMPQAGLAAPASPAGPGKKNKEAAAPSGPAAPPGAQDKAAALEKSKRASETKGRRADKGENEESQRALRRILVLYRTRGE